MGANKIILNNKVLLDLEGDTVTEADVAEGVTFHKADGSPAVGTNTGGSTSNTTPPEISTETEMNALEIGTVFRYVGETTEAFENGAYYVVEETVSGYTIDFSGLSVNGNTDTSTLTIYDGQDDSGKVVYQETSTQDFTLTSYQFTSGYFYITFTSSLADDFNDVSATGGVTITSYSTSAATTTYATGMISGDGAISGSLYGDC